MPVAKVSEIRKQEFFDAAMELVNEKGFEKITVQSIIDKLGVSKGAFYHYFNSKQELLDVIIVYFTKRIVKILRKIVADEKLNALEKLNKMILTAKEYKAAQKELNVEYIKLLRQGTISLTSPRILEITMEIVRPIYREVIEQGVKEGIFNTSYPDEATDLLMHMANHFNITIGKLFLNSWQESDFFETIQQKIFFFEDAFERLLGLKKGSINLAGPHLKNIKLYTKILKDNDILK